MNEAPHSSLTLFISIIKSVLPPSLTRKQQPLCQSGAGILNNFMRKSASLWVLNQGRPNSSTYFAI
jgi:hypothetical protein